MKKNHPNVIFILTDDQGYGDLSCYGNSIIQTPNLDEMHGESIRFTDFHVGPVCAPTRAGLTTGHYHNKTGVWHTLMGRSLLRKNETTIAEIFKANGYKTALFGKWHLGDNYPFRPQDRGFEVVKYHGGGGVGQTPDYWGNDYFNDTYYVNDGIEKFCGYCTDIWFDEALKFIEKNIKNPFYVYISTNAPHSPFNVAKKYKDLYREETKDYRARFYGMITNIDENIGKLRHKIKQLGIENNTILIFMTDNGSVAGSTIKRNQHIREGYNAGMRGIKGSEYEGGHRVPFFLHFPRIGLNKGKDITMLASYVDFLPTLIDLCELKTPEDYLFDGISLKPLILGNDNDWSDRIIFTDNQWDEYPEKWKKSAVMTPQWRLINGKELYDIKKDPSQKEDIAECYPEIVKNMRKEYNKWWDTMKESFKIPCPIEIGNDVESETRLVCVDWHGTTSAWSQGTIREGFICNGYWVLNFLKEGKYLFELRRWPREENRAINDGIPDTELKPYHQTNWYSGGKALNIKSARIRVGYIEKSQKILPEQKFSSFRLKVKKGLTQMTTWFKLEDDTELGAYYVYITFLNNSN